MCKHSTAGVDRLAKRQRGLDARGNDPMATKRESSFAAEFVRNPPGDSLATTITYLNTLPDRIGNKNIIGTPVFKQKLSGLGPNPTGMAFTNFFADGNTGFKGLIDEIANPIATANDALEGKARDQPYFQNRGGPNSKRGRNKGGLSRERRQSMDSRHLGITSGQDRTADTTDGYTANVFHAKGMLLAQMDDQTVKDFQKAGVPFIGGASGTLQQIAMEMEIRKPREQLNRNELREREKVLAMLSVQHVAAGHHSLGECLLGAKPYGYFEDVPNPLEDYDGAMRGFEKHLQDLGLGGGQQPLSRKAENQDKSKREIKYADRLGFVKTLFERYQDQLPPDELLKIQQRMTEASNQAQRGEHGPATKTLAKTENLIRGQAALIASTARGNNHVLRPDELDAKLRAAPKKRKESSAEYKEVKRALADYDQQIKELAGRKLDHDRAFLGFEALRAALATAGKAATAYQTKVQNDPAKADLHGAMADLIAKLDVEQRLLEDAQRDSNDYNMLGDVTIEQSIEYARFGIKPGTQAKPNVLKESRITNKQVLGTGGINTVMLIDYKAEGNDPAQQRAFKPEPEKIKIAQSLIDMGIDPNQPRTGKRNIASKRIALAAGLGDLIPGATFATVDGKVGLAMHKAKGKTPNTKVPVPINNPDGINDLKAALDAKNRNDPEWKSKIPEKNGLGMRYGYDDQAQKFTKEDIRTRVLPMTAPPGTPQQVAAVQQQLTNLQWLDVVSGQVDRHAENYLMDTDSDPPAIMGIDNDFSFGKNRRDPTQRSGNAFSFPPVVDQATFDGLKAMVQNWPQIAASLTGELEPAEIDATKARLDAVEQQLNQLQTAGMVVQSWDQPVNGRPVTDILRDAGRGGSYYQRDVENQQYMQQAGMTAN